MRGELSQSYSDPTGGAALEALVDRIEANPGRMIRPGEFDVSQHAIDARAVMARLPQGMTEADFVGAVQLELFTECATESYAAVFESQARRFNAPWLGRFTHNIWTPDELTHHAPFKLILLQLGFGETELDRAIRHTQQMQYVHQSGDTPIHLTTFGMVQEYLTDNWHGLVAQMLRPAAPAAAEMVFRIKRRETLHTTWYRDMTALQIEANPGLFGHVAEALATFQMPGNVVAPELQAAAHRWMPLMGGDIERIFQDLVRLVHTLTHDVRRTGTLLVQMAAMRGDRIAPVSPRHIKAALDVLGGPGYGLIGEALLERVGLDYLFRTPRPPDTPAVAPFARDVHQIRKLLRSWLSRHIELNLSGAPPGGS